MDTHTADDLDLAHRLRGLVEEAEGLLGGAARSGDEALDSMRGKFASRVRQLHRQLDHFEDAAAGGARRALGATDRSVREHPYTAIGMAAATGLLLGALLARR